jgi:cell division septal protein FtsQ
MRNWKLIILFVVIIIFTFSGIVLSGLWKDKSTIKRVDFTGNTTLSREEIFDFAKLNDSMICSNSLSLEMIESRISKHPNIKKVVVTKDAAIIKIDISEKNPFAVASNGKEMFLVDDQLSIYNLKKEHKDIDLPVITGVSDQMSVSTFGKNDLKNLKIAQYIISQSIKINKSLYNYISEISFTDSSQISLVTSDDATPVFFIDYNALLKKEKFETPNLAGDINNESLRRAIDNKLIQLNGFLKQVRVYKTANCFKYIDMRYNDMIVVKNNNQPSEKQQ